MGYRNYSSRIGGLNHWLFAQDDFKHLIERPFRGETYSNVLNGSGVVKGEQRYPKGYQDMIIPELKRRSDFLSEIPALSSIKPEENKVITVLVGDKDDPSVAASRSYVGMKSATTKASGLGSIVAEFPAKTTAAELYSELEKWNADPTISILMFQLPFGGEAGRTIDTTALRNRIDISKDGDGLNQTTLGLMSLGADRYYDCCTPSGMLDLASVYLVRNKNVKLRPDGIANFAGIEVVVAGRSAIVGEPLFNMLKCFDATVTGPLHTRNGAGYTNDKATQKQVYMDLAQRADIVFSCMGFHPYNIHEGNEYFFTPDMIKEGCVVIDAATSFRKDGKKPYGDVDPAARSKASAITLETGCVGPATVTKLVHQGWNGMLFRNVDSVRQALKDNQDIVKSSYAELLAQFADATVADAQANADQLYERAIDVNSHPVHAIDALEYILDKLMK